MVTVYDVDPRKFINRAANRLKAEFKAIQPPEWAAFVKSGVGRQRAPAQKDFWYLRCASMLRKLYVGGTVGVSRLRTAYGSRKKKGVRRRHFSKAGGAILRKGLQQLEKAGLVRKAKTGGRLLTSKGRAFMDSVAKEVKNG
ncbi:MAG: 30S ribosomal protein S19e [Candidatus Aenigmarchaeota archaeon]|nr:30S ribosomal protein S19e [Candidatus Aenigmarchaeota archaeon]